MKSGENDRKKGGHVGSIILHTVTGYGFLSAGILIAVVGAVVLALIPPLVLGDIVDTLTTGSTLPLRMVVLYFTMLAMTGIMESAREGLLTVFGQKITHAVRSSLMEKLIKLSADELNRQEPGNLVSRFVGDVDTVENLFTSGIISMFADACRIISIIVVIWVKNTGLAIVLLLLLPVLFLFTGYVQKNMLASQLENRRAVGRASGHVPETIHNIRTIHCLRKERYMEEKYDTYIGQSYRAMEKTNFYDAVYSPVILILNAVVVAVVMLLSASGNTGVLAFFGMSAGTAVAVINYISEIFSPVESLGMEIQTIQSAFAGIKRINEFLELPEKNKYDGAKSRLAERVDGEDKEGKNKEENISGNSVENQEESNGQPVVELMNVTFGYDEHVVLDNVSFAIRKGEQATLSGRTGAGKSTIFKLLLGLYEPQSGSVLINGMPASTIEDSRRRRMFGYVEQSFHMVPGTVKEQITLFDKSITDDAVKAAARLAGLDDTIMKLGNGYDTVCTPELFSQGQWQLLSIARAAAAEPELLLLDEITANLDAETEKTVLQALKNVSKDRTVLSISHRTMAETGRIISIQ